MAKGQQRSNKEKKKPKQKKVDAAGIILGKRSKSRPRQRQEGLSRAALCPHGWWPDGRGGAWLRIVVLSFLLALLSCTHAGGGDLADRHGRRRNAQFHARGAARAE